MSIANYAYYIITIKKGDKTNSLVYINNEYSQLLATFVTGMMNRNVQINVGQKPGDSKNWRTRTGMT